MAHSHVLVRHEQHPALSLHNSHWPCSRRHCLRSGCPLLIVMCLGRLFAGTVLAGLEPGALLLTGDLVDGKTALGRGHQLKTEWEVCSSAWEIKHSET